MKRLHIYFLSCILTFMAGYLPVGAQGLPPDSTVNNIIYYTSSDSAIVMPNNPNAFGANIVSNTYENGQGQIVFDGDVTVIGNMAFNRCTNLSSIELPNSITLISEYAFIGCSGLTSMSIPNSVSTIQYNAFAGCTSLRSVEIPNSVVSIGASAFSSCSSLTSVVIPESVEALGNAVFQSCVSLEAFYGKYASEDNRCLIVDGTLNSFAPAGLTSYSIPGTISAIGDYAFAECTELTSVEIPSSVTSIGYRTFEGCVNLTTVDIANSVTTIGGWAFASCTSLTSIVIPSSVTLFGDFAFYECRGMANIQCEALTPPACLNGVFSYVSQNCILSVPAESLELYKTTEPWSRFWRIIAIGEVVGTNNVIYYYSTDGDIVTPTSIEAFDANIISNSLVDGQGQIVFDDDITMIGARAFDGCTTLMSMEIPKSVTEIGQAAYKGCTSLFSVEIPNSVTTIRSWAFESCTSMTSVEIPNSVVEIESFAFIGCTDLRTVEIPMSVMEIGEGAFSLCSGLESFSGKFASEDNRCLVSNDILVSFAPSGLTSYSIPNSVKEIGRDAFRGASILTSVEIPSSVSVIGESAFQDCSGLASVEIPNSVTEIRTNAFWECANLVSIEIPNSVTLIGDCAFRCCYGLTSVEIPSSVTKIGGWAFCDCTGLKSVVIPNSITNIESGMFSGCTSLKEITCMAVTPPTCADWVFNNVPKNECVLKVPAESLELYKTTEPWSQFFNIVAIDDNRCFAMLMHNGEETVFYGEEALADALAVAEDGDEIQLSAGEFNAVDIEKAVTIRGNGWLASDSITPTRLIGDFSITQPMTLQRSNERLTLRGIYHDGQITKKNGRCSFIQCRLGELNVQQITRDVTEENSGVYLRQTKVQRAMYVGSGNTVSCENTFIYDPHTEGSGSINFEHCMVFNLSNEVTNSNFSNTIIDCCQTVALDGSNTANYCLSVGGNSTACFNIIGNSTCTTLIGHDIFKTFGAWGFTDEENYELTDEAAKTYIGSDGTQIGINGGQYPFNGTMPQISRFCVDGIWYHILSEEEKTVEVTYNGEFNGKFVVDNAYSGDIKIPSNVNYSSKDYTVEAIGEFAFDGCRDLSSIILPNTIKVIKGYSFYDASSLITLEVPNSVTVIEKSAFHACNSLETIVLGESLNTIMGDAFSDCLSIQEITCHAATPPNCIVDERTNVFEKEIYTRSTLYVQEQSLELYKTTEPWSEFFNIVAIGSEVDENNVIYYTSTDGNIVEPNNPDAFGANIVSNTYENGQGKIVFDGDVAEIGKEAFNKCSGLTSVVIPNSVTTIGYFAFADCSGLTSVEIPNSVTTIGIDAFYNCTGLTSIEIPNSVTSIEAAAFSACTGLTSLEIPNSVTTIGYAAFSSCSSLTSVEIPNTVATIGDGVFSNCTSLERFTGKFSSEDNRYLVVDGVLNSFAPAGLTSYSIPNSIIAIGRFAFRGCYQLTSVEIPNSVTTIGDNAFSFCRGLTSVEIPNSVTKIGRSAFEYCYGQLTSVKIPNSVTEIGERAFFCCFDLKEITCEAVTPPACGNEVFYYVPTDNCVLRVPIQSFGLYKTTEPWSQFFNIVPIVGDDTNNVIYYTSTDGEIVTPYRPNDISGNIVSNTYANGLGMIVFDKDVTYIGDWAFRDCSNLKTVEIPASVEMLGLSPFHSCTNLESFTGKFASEDHRCLIRNAQLVSFAPAGLTEYEIPDNVVTIGSQSFSGSTELTSVKIPNSVTKIDICAFFECTGLTSVDIPESVNFIGNQAFRYCSSLTSIKIPSAVTTIEDMLFSGCTSLAYVELPNSITSIGEQAFRSCSSLAHIEIPQSVTSIGVSAFASCRSLTSVAIPQNVTIIEEYAFSACSSLASIEIPSSVDSIGSNAFSYCGNVAELTCEATIPPSCGEDVFYNLPTHECVLRVPAQSRELYRNTEPWSQFFNIVPIEGEIVRDSLFMVGGLWYELLDGDAMTCALTYSRDSEYQGDVEVPESVEYNEETWSVTAIGANAFRGCKGLTSIILPPHLDNIVDEEFGTGNPNLLLYCERKEMAPRDVRNVVVDGVADFIRLSDDGDFNCPREFMAKKISYEREFRQHTGLGYSEGWETLALPFDVQTVYHRDKQEEINGFWLRELTNDGFMPASEIHANTPYIISMPNNEEYVEACRLAGRVSFRATNAVVPCSEMATASSANRLFIPTMTAVERADDVYALNVNQEYDGHRAGSIFVSGLRAIKPFEAYILTRQYAPLLSLTELSNGTVGISTPQSSGMAGKVNVYDAGGRLVKVDSDKKGKDLLNDLPEGIYVIKGAKTRK